MFASNFPVDKIDVSFQDLMEVHKAITKDYTKDEQESYFGLLAKRVYQLE